MGQETKRSFETSLEALQQVVTELQAGEVSLERTVELYRQGVNLRRECEERLGEAERLIETLSRDDQGQPITEPYEENGPASRESYDTDLTDDDVPF